MKIRNYLRQIFKIEYILVFTTVVTVMLILGFKGMSEKRFDSLDSMFKEIESGTKILDFDANGLKDAVHPYIYFDAELNGEFERIKQLVNEDYTANGGNKLSDSTIIALQGFQNNIHIMQRGLLSGYDSLLYFSIILLSIAVFVILYKKFLQVIELKHIQAVNEEHVQFSRNLHDGVSQDLMAIKLYLEKGDAQKTSFYADRANEKVRYLIDSMNMDLEADIKTLLLETVNAFENNYELKTNVFISDDALNDIPQTSQIEILYIVQEALSNIARHANATQVDLKIIPVGDMIHITIHDNGVGFSEEKANNSGDGKLHWGIKNIRKRVEQLNGTVDFINDGGTTIAIRIANTIH